MEPFKRLTKLPSEYRTLSNEELTLAVLNIHRQIEYVANTILEIMEMERKIRATPPDANALDNKINELARLRTGLKDFRLYG
jgi:cell division protein FtsL